MKRSFETKFKSNWHCVVGKLHFHLNTIQAATLVRMSPMKLADTSISILDRRASSFGPHLHEQLDLSIMISYDNYCCVQEGADVNSKQFFLVRGAYWLIN